MEILLLAAISIIVGLLVGVLSGMLGLGGGTLLVPIFKLGYALDPIMATATSLFTIIPTSVSGVVTHVRNKTCLPALGLAAGIGGAITSPIGVWLASISPDWTIMVAAALVIAYSSITMFQKAIKSLKRDRQKEHARIENTSSGEEDIKNESLDTVRFDLAKLITKRNVVICATIGIAAGVMSGYVGVGGGFIMIPLFMQLLNLPLRLTSGTSLIAIMIIATSGTVLQAYYGNINWIAGIFVSIGSIPGAYFGSKLITKVPETVLRFIFSGFLIVAAALLVLNQLNVF